MKKLINIVALVLVIAISTFALTGCNPSDDHMKEGHLTKATSLNINENGKFKVLQFTDTHLISNGDNKRDEQTLRWMKEATLKVKPDLVELTGDITGSGTKGRNSGILAIANMFEEMEQYWAYSFGNHDGEWSKQNKSHIEKWIGKEGKQTLVKDVCSTPNSDPKFLAHVGDGDLYYGDNTKGNQEIFELLHGYKYCLSRQSEWEKQEEFRAAMGVGNYVIELKNNENKVVYALIHMDTHGKMYFKPKGSTNPKDFKDQGYVGLTDKQIEWYEIQAKKYAEMGVKTSIFMHIPHYGFREVTEDYVKHNDYGVPQFKEKENLLNLVQKDLFNDLKFVKKEGIYSCSWDDNLEKAVDKYKTTNMIAVGHDHNNCFYIRKNIKNKFVEENDQDNEILIAYGRCSGVNAWGRMINIGATIYDIDTTATSLENMYDVSVIYPEFDYVQKYKGAEINCTDPNLN